MMMMIMIVDDNADDDGCGGGDGSDISGSVFTYWVQNFSVAGADSIFISSSPKVAVLHILMLVTLHLNEECRNFVLRY